MGEVKTLATVAPKPFEMLDRPVTALVASLCFVLLCSLSSAQYPYDTVYRIDCGGFKTFTNEFNQTWLSDRFYSSGASALVSQPHNFKQEQERSLRFFPIAMGKKNCYTVNVSSGRYYIRMFFVYDNYDSRKHSPSFDVSVEGTLVFSWRSPWTEAIAKYGAYSDLFAFIRDGEATICLYSIATDAPLMASLEIVQVDPLCYSSPSTGEKVVLVNYGRLTCGSSSFGPGFTNHTDRFGRAWQSDASFRNSFAKKRTLSTEKHIKSTDQAHEYIPNHLYQSALTLETRAPLEYEFAVDTRLDYMLWFHFVEIDEDITGPEQRVFDIIINDKIVHRIDIFKEVGSYTALRWQYQIRNLTKSTINVLLEPVVGIPCISGLENYALVPMDITTDPSQVDGMRSLKKSLHVPDRMGWNGDPCAPTTWDAWEGVTCSYNKDRTALIITQLDLGSQGLQGYISEDIKKLSNLLSLNLSNNKLHESIPTGLGQGSLKRVDLSNNQLSGSIPKSLGSSQLHQVSLDNNNLEGQVPDNLYSIGTQGGIINLAGNKGLCGVPSLPSCPHFWEKSNLPASAKVAISLSSIVAAILLFSLCCCWYRRRHRNDYDFGLGLPQDVILKSHRYHKQKPTASFEKDTNVMTFPTSNVIVDSFIPL